MRAISEKFTEEEFHLLKGEKDKNNENWHDFILGIKSLKEENSFLRTQNNSLLVELKKKDKMLIEELQKNGRILTEELQKKDQTIDNLKPYQ